MADVVERHATNETTSTKGLRPIGGLLGTHFLGTFNDNAWKQLVVMLALAAAATESQGQKQVAIAQIALILPQLLVSLPAGVLADRMGKQSLIVRMKALELALMVLGVFALVVSPAGGLPALIILGLLGVQAALYSPAKYGILPEILPHGQLSRGNALLEATTTIAIIGGTVAAGPLFASTHGAPWLAGVPLVALAALGLFSAMRIPTVAPARRDGGLGTTIQLAKEAIGGDRVLRLAVAGQVIVWSIACLIPPPMLSYAKVALGLKPALANLPLGVLGLGIGLGCFLAGKMSRSNVEYGLLPLGAFGMAISALTFAAWGPGFYGMMVLMALLGMFSGFLLVPLSALIQWRAPADRRGAVIATTNAIAFAGMLAGSVLALALAEAEVSGRWVFFLMGIGLSGGFLWALALVPEAFLRFLFLGMTSLCYRVRFVGKENIPAEGQALLVPNHVSFADGLFIMALTDRPVRFVVYAEFFNKPIIGRMLRTMRAIPISASGGPRMILQAFRECGRALDAGEIVCIFPEGQLSRTGLVGPFQRGLTRIVRKRTTPILPIHLDRLYDSVFAPVSGRKIPDRIPFPVTVSVGPALPSTASLFEIRQAIRDLDYGASAYRKLDHHPLHHGFVRVVRRHGGRMALMDLQKPGLSYRRTLAASLAIAHRLRPRWEGQQAVGIMLPASMGAAVLNLAASFAGKTAVNLNFTAGRAGMESAAKQAGLKTLITSRQFLEKARLEPPAGVELIYAEDEMQALSRADKLKGLALALFARIPTMERYAGATRPVAVDDAATIIFSSGSTGDPKGVVLTHENIVSDIQAIRRMYRVLPQDRLASILPFFHSFGYTMFWFAKTSGMGSAFHPSPLDALAIGKLVERFRVTVLMATPTFLNLYIRRCSPGQFGSLRLVLAGAEKLPDSLLAAFEDTFGIRPMEGYGLTECAPVVAVNAFDYRMPGFFQPGSRRGFVGQPVPGVAIRIVAAETFEPLGANEEGLVLIKGPNVMSGYLGRDDLTQKAFVDGWYNSGDLGFLSDDGFLKITGRLSRFSKIGGEMVPHGRVEEALQDAVAPGSQNFAVTAVRDAKKGEKLIVLTTVDADKVDQALRRLGEMGLPNLFIPRRENVFKVDALPLLGSGKLDLRAVQKLAEESIASNASTSIPG